MSPEDRNAILEECLRALSATDKSSRDPSHNCWRGGWRDAFETIEALKSTEEKLINARLESAATAIEQRANDMQINNNPTPEREGAYGAYINAAALVRGSAF